MIRSRDHFSSAEVGVPASLSPWRISTERYLDMIREGALGPEDRVELINGMMIDMSPAGSKHDDVIDRLNEQLFPIRGSHRVRIQSTLIVSEGQVYDPDVMILKQRPDHDAYASRHPDSNDVALLIEVSGSSLAKDRDIKLPAYASAQVPEFWLVDLESETVTVYREPVDTAYGSIQKLGKGQALTALCLPEQAFEVDKLFA